ncbi:MAG: NusA-like transcription termination signal-binding factor [Nanoarchaeota archaeon]
MVAVKFKYDMQTLQWMNLFEKVTKAKLRDIIVEGEKVFFVVERGQLRKALGPDKKHVKRLEELLDKRVKIIQYTENVHQFIINVLSPLKVVDLKEEDGIVTIKGPDQKTRGLMIGSRAANLRLYERIVQKYFPDIKELKVI